MGQVQLPTPTAKVIEKMKTPAKDIGDEVMCLPAGLAVLGMAIYLFLKSAFDFEAFAGLYMLSAVLISLYFACFMEDRRIEQMPNTRAYGWGYFWGCTGLAGLPMLVLSFWAMLKAGQNGQRHEFGEILGYCLFLAFNATTGWFVIKRKRWAWVWGTISSGNPAIWVINYFYGRKRWNELK